MPDYKTLYFDGKAVMPLDQFINLVGGSGNDGTRTGLVKLYATVSWLYRAVNIRENGVSSMPFEIRRGEKVVYEYDPNTGTYDTPPTGLEFLVDIPWLSGMVEGANILRGKAYIYNIRNNRRTLELRWLKPDSVEPRYDESGILSSFIRDRNGREQRLEIEDVLWFWMPDKFVENGPAANYPGQAALAAANVLFSMDEFLRGYFDRGLVAAGFLKYEQQISESEKERVKEWWNRLTNGVRRAFENLIVRGDFTYEAIGNGLKELENTDLAQQERESIATALGIPQSKMTQPPGGLGDTQSPDNLAFVSDTVIPACNWIQRAWNRRYFLERGYMMVYTPQKLPIMQQDEERRSVAFRNYVGTGVAPGYTVEEAEAILGIHVPDDVRQTVRDNARQQLAQATGPEKSIDLLKALDKRDERGQFLRWLKNRKGQRINPNDFETIHLSFEEKVSVVKQFQRIEVDGDIPPDGFDEIADVDVRAALADWDKKMPDQRGLLDADVVE